MSLSDQTAIVIKVPSPPVPRRLVSVPVYLKMGTLQGIDAQDMTAQDFKLAGYVSEAAESPKENASVMSELDRLREECNDVLKQAEATYERVRLTIAGWCEDADNERIRANEYAHEVPRLNRQLEATQTQLKIQQNWHKIVEEDRDRVRAELLKAYEERDASLKNDTDSLQRIGGKPHESVKEFVDRLIAEGGFVDWNL